MKFTDRFLQSIKPPEKEYCIREGHGFTLRILPSGLKTFQYIYTLNGIRHRLNLGHYPVITLAEAREKYHEAYLLVSRGQNPAQKASSPDTDAPLSVAALIDRYKQFATQHFASSTVRETKRTLNKYVLPAWKDRSAISIRRSDAISLIEPLAASSPGQARGVMKIARAMFNYALDRELVDLNPFTRLPSAIPAVKPCSGKRVLSDSEIRALWETLTGTHAPGTPESRRALMLILITGQRPGEVAGMQWSEIEGDWWTIPFDRIKTRNHRQENHRVFLSPLAKQLIGQNPGYSNYVFIGSRPDLSIAEKALSHLVNKKTEGGRTMRDGSVTTARPPYFGLPRWTPHDLRRTAATRLSELGCTDEAIDAILNHAKSGVISVYNLNKYDKEKKEWLTTWGNHLSTLLNPPALVTPT
jgi:integrase